MLSRLLQSYPRFDSVIQRKQPYSLAPNSPRRYPIGISDWKEIKTEGYFFWDRTKFIKEFYEDPGKSVLILRPRRWAKSTTMSMAKYFFDICNPKLASEIFSETQIASEEDFIKQCQAQFPVVAVSFGECRAKTWVDMEKDLNAIISRVYQDHRYLTENNFLFEDEQHKFKAILNEDPKAHYKFALRNLTALLNRYHKKRVVVLIDEYDKPVNEAHENGFYDDAIPFLTSAFTGALKDNPCIEKGLLTGVLRVAKSGYLSGLNNLNVYSLLDPEYVDQYGVKQDELDEALKHEGLSDKASDVKSYYNGYITAVPSMLLYNPWSILQYLSKKRLAPYWIETGKTDFIANAMWSSPLLVRQKILPLLNGETLLVPFEVDINYNALDSSPVLWSLLYFSGYLTGRTVDNENLNVCIPNSEVKRELSVMWRRVIEGKHLGDQYSEVISGLLSGNQCIIETNLQTLARELFSTHDLAREPEAFYHGFMLSLLYPLNVQGYRIESNRESGLGRADIMLHPPPSLKKPPVIIELKTRTKKEERDAVKKDSDLQPDAEDGLKQIIEKDYVRALNTPTKTVILCSIAFVKKFVAVSIKEVSL